MKQLLKFELTRLKNRKLLLLMPLVFIIIGISGMILANVFYEQVDAKIKILNVLNAYNQFTFIFFSFVYIHIFATDFKKGISVYMAQIGYSLKTTLITKSIVLYLISVISSNITMIVLFYALGNSDFSYLFTLLFTFDINLIFIVLFSLLLSLLLKNSMTATLICFAMFIVFNTANLMFYGVFNQADPNSISYNAILKSIGEKVTHRTLSGISLDLVQYKYLCILLPNILWVTLLSSFILILIKKRGNKIEL